MSTFFVLRHELVKAAVSAIQVLYPDKLADIQAVKDGDGSVLKTIHWGAHTPRSVPQTVGGLAQWYAQAIELELRASVDYLDRSLDSRYMQLLEVFEDFCAQADLPTHLSNDKVNVLSHPTFDGIEETIENNRYITVYRLTVLACGK